jgi:hypothetical protein
LIVGLGRMIRGCPLIRADVEREHRVSGTWSSARTSATNFSSMEIEDVLDFRATCVAMLL